MAYLAFMSYMAYMSYESIGSLTLFRFEGRVVIKLGSSVIKKVSQSGSTDVARFTKSLWCVKTLAIKEGVIIDARWR